MKAELKNIITIREGAQSDHSFIYATWLRGLYYGNSFFRQIEKTEFMERYHLIIQNILFKQSAAILVACLVDDPDTVVGYSVSENLEHLSILHWIFIKPEWRQMKISEDLIPDSVNTITHIVDALCKLKLKNNAKSDKWLSNYDISLKHKKLQFKPFLI